MERRPSCSAIQLKTTAGGPVCTVFTWNIRVFSTVGRKILKTAGRLVCVFQKGQNMQHGTVHSTFIWKSIINIYPDLQLNGQRPRLYSYLAVCRYTGNGLRVVALWWAKSVEPQIKQSAHASTVQLAQVCLSSFFMHRISQQQKNIINDFAMQSDDHE